MRAIKKLITISFSFLILFTLSAQEDNVIRKEVMNINFKGGTVKSYNLLNIDSLKFEYVTPELDFDLISTVQQIQLAPNAKATFSVYVDKEDYLDQNLYPFYVEILENSEALSVGTAEYQLRYDSKGYDVTLTVGSQKGEYTCRVVLGSYVKDIPLTIDYGVYLSVSRIKPEVTLDDMVTSKPHIVELGQTIEDIFYCYLDGASDEQKAKVKEILLDKENYLHDDLNIEIGDIKLDDTKDVWVVTVPITAATKVYERGLVTLSIEDKTLTYDITCDDGKHFDELYISFEYIYTWNEETKVKYRLLEKYYTKYVGTNNISAEKERFKIPVYYTMSPDDRADYINWNLNIPMGINAPVKYIGMERVGYNIFEFEFEVQAAGEANIQFSIENPKADDPTLSASEREFYEKYRYQTLTALINVIDRNTVDVEDIVFLDDEDPLIANILEYQETSSGTVALYSYIMPEESVGAWPAVYSIECKNGAEATVKQVRVDEKTGEEYPATLEITHAGTIVVTATSKDKTAQLIVNAKFKIDQSVLGEKLQLQTAKNEYIPGETDKIKTTLRSSYKVNDYEYTWVSSNPDVVSVDAYGNVTAVSDGTAIITASITDDYGYTAVATKEISVRSVSADADLNTPEWDDYYVVKLESDAPGCYYIDTYDGSYLLYTLYLSNDIVENGIYKVGYDITGTIDFPSNDRFNLVGGTITISDEGWTFDLQVSDGNISGTVTGSKPYILIEY